MRNFRDLALFPARVRRLSRHIKTARQSGGPLVYPCRDSNAGHRLRRPVLYPSELQGRIPTTRVFYHIREVDQEVEETFRETNDEVRVGGVWGCGGASSCGMVESFPEGNVVPPVVASML